MFNSGGTGVFANNNVSDANDAISSNHSRGVQFTNNTVTDSDSGVHTDNSGDGGGTADLISGNTVTNSRVNGYGIWVFVPYKTVIVQNNTVTNVDIGMAAAGMAPTITSRPAYGTTQLAAPGRRAPASFAVEEPDSVYQPTPQKAKSTSPSIAAAAAAATFTGNTIDGQNKANSTGVYFTTNEFGFGSSDIRVTFDNNTVLNNVDGFHLEAETGFTLNVAAKLNRIINNSNSQVIQASGSGFTGTLNGVMENNWWGCNAGPNNTGCGVVNGSGVDFNPWIVLGVGASPGSLTLGGTSTVTADMSDNSAMTDTLGLGSLPTMPVAWSATQGTMIPTSGTITADVADSTFTSTSGNNATSCAMVDNQLTCTPLTVTVPTVQFSSSTYSVNENAGTVTLTVTKTESTAFSTAVNYTTSDGTATKPGDYTATSGSVTFLPAETSKDITVPI